MRFLHHWDAVVNADQIVNFSCLGDPKMDGSAEVWKLEDLLASRVRDSMKIKTTFPIQILMNLWNYISCTRIVQCENSHQNVHTNRIWKAMQKVLGNTESGFVSLHKPTTIYR